MIRLNKLFVKLSKATSVIFIITMGLFFVGLTSSSHAELTGDYQFQNTLQSSTPPAPPLVDLGAGQFAFDTVNGENRQVFRFNFGEGLRLATTGVISNNVYTIVALFEFSDLSLDSFQKIIDFKNLVIDMGLYAEEDEEETTITDGVLTFYDEASGTDIVFNDGVYVQVVLTRDAGGTVVGYVNGVQQFSFQDDSDFAVISDDDFLIFFRDDDVTDNSENSPGSVACLQVYDIALSAQEVAAINCLEPVARNVPTVSEWGLIAMAVVLGIVALVAIRRRKVTA